MSPALKRAARTKIRRNSVAGEQNPRRFSAHRRTRSTHVSSDKGKQSNNNIVPKMSKQKSESLPVPQIFIEKADKKSNSSIIADEPEEVEIQKDIGPIRITLKDEIADPELLSGESNLLKVNTSELVKPIQPGKTSPTSISPTSPTIVTPTSSTSKRTSAWSSWFPWPGGSEEKDKEEKEPKPKKNKPDKSDKSDKSDKNENENNDSTVKEKDKEKSPKKSFTFFPWPQNKGKSTDDSLTTMNTNTSLSQPNISNKKTKYTNYNRLPIHVERAIYRLSHVKLANPRRPLHEQVLISNMMFWYLSLINKQQVGDGNQNAEMAAHKVKSKVGKVSKEKKRKKPQEKKSRLTKKGAGPGSSAEIAYKAPQYDMNQISQQYMTTEFDEETTDDFVDSSDYHNEEEFPAHSYHHYNDEYLSDGTDLDEVNGRIESSHSGGLLHSSAVFDDNIGESSNGVKSTKYIRSPSPNGRSKSPTGRPPSPNKKSTPSTPPTPQRNSVPPSNKSKLINIPRNRSSSAGTKLLNSHSEIPPKISSADDEDDDVPLGGLYKIPKK